MPGILYIVATPIGNLEDITLRALRILREADLIACEDTRHTKILLDKYEIHKPLVSYHQHSQIQKTDYLVDEMKAGKTVAMVSDAGTPGISDPGSVLVSAALKKNIVVVPIPGASAAVTCASVAGIPMDKFLFLGFLPHKKGRQTLLHTAAESAYPVVFYESPHRIKKLLEELAGLDGLVIIGRELTKKFEEIIRGEAKEVAAVFPESKAIGEFVVIFWKNQKR